MFTVSDSKSSYQRSCFKRRGLLVNIREKYAQPNNWYYQVDVPNEKKLVAMHLTICNVYALLKSLLTLITISFHLLMVFFKSNPASIASDRGSLFSGYQSSK